MKRTETGELCTVPEAARRAGVGLRQIRRAIDSGEIEVYEVGGWPRLRYRSVQEFIERRRRPRPQGTERTEGRDA